MKIDGKLDEEAYAVTSADGRLHPDRSAPRRAGHRSRPRSGSSTTTRASTSARSATTRRPKTTWVANEMRRDSMNVVRNENFAIYFDTFYDRRNAFLFELSPIGGIYDAYVTNERAPGNTDYNPIWQRQAGRFDKGWIAEMAIPFRALRYRPGSAQVWGVNMRRTVRWKNEESFIQKVPADAGERHLPDLARRHARRHRRADRQPQARSEAVRHLRRLEQPAVRPARVERRDRRRRLRREVRPDAEPHGRLHVQHRLRAGRSGRAAGEPDAVPGLLPGEARVLPRGRRASSTSAVRVPRRAGVAAASRRSCSSAGASA